jgi:hypothetical protein
MDRAVCGVIEWISKNMAKQRIARRKLMAVNATRNE